MFLRLNSAAIVSFLTIFLADLSPHTITAETSYNKKQKQKKHCKLYILLCGFFFFFNSYF